MQKTKTIYTSRWRELCIICLQCSLPSHPNKQLTIKEMKTHVKVLQMYMNASILSDSFANKCCTVNFYKHITKCIEQVSECLGVKRKNILENWGENWSSWLKCVQLYIPGRGCLSNADKTDVCVTQCRTFRTFLSVVRILQ